jgi:hypothetical protein
MRTSVATDDFRRRCPARCCQIARRAGARRVCARPPATPNAQGHLSGNDSLISRIGREKARKMGYVARIHSRPCSAYRLVGRDSRQRSASALRCVGTHDASQRAERWLTGCRVGPPGLDSSARLQAATFSRRWACWGCLRSPACIGLSYDRGGVLPRRRRGAPAPRCVSRRRERRRRPFRQPTGMSL